MKEDNDLEKLESPIDAGEGSCETPSLGVTRREVLKGAAAFSAATFFPSLSPAALENFTVAEETRPNVLFILVDQMRFPKHFPQDVKTPGEFLQKFMPNTYSLWSKGVKFAKHFTASNDCSPARGTIVTGLYSQQTWCVNSLVYQTGASHADSPPLNPAFPTYGKLLRKAGYQTPYIGKWHLSLPEANADGVALTEYGFEGLIMPDPTGNNLQGTYGNDAGGLYSDSYIAQKAVNWLNSPSATKAPWCLTVGFQNPHDKEFFPAGTEFQTWTQMYAEPTLNPNGYTQFYNYTQIDCGNAVPWATNLLQNPPSYGYPAVPGNWQTIGEIFTNKPSWQTVALQLSSLFWGGASFDPQQKNFTMAVYPTTPGQAPSTQGVLNAPFSYWKRSSDSYTQILQALDVNVGAVLNAIPESLAQNTIVVFTSDHGEYAGSHGFLSGKTGTFYNECANVPLIVHDPTGRYAGDKDVIRTGLTSHVDLLPMLVGFAYGGRTAWMKGDLAQMYGHRHHIIPMLKSSKAQGRKAAYFTTDETAPANLNFLMAPLHILGMVTPFDKVAVYSHWYPNSTAINSNRQEIEYYDYSTQEGLDEVLSLPGSDAARNKAQRLLNLGLKGEIQKPLPKRYKIPQQVAHQETIAYFNLTLMSLGAG